MPIVVVGPAAVPVGGGGAGRASTQRTKPHVSAPGPTGVEGAGGSCRGAGGRRRGLAGLRDDAPSEARGADGSRADRRPPAHTAAGPSGAQNTRGATSNTINDSGRRPRAHQAARPNKPPGGAWNTSGTISNNTRRRQLAGGRARRRPQHQRRNTPHRQNKTARPHRGRAAQSVSEAHRRTTMMSGSPRPLSWRTLEIPSLAATSFAVPSMRGSS